MSNPLGARKQDKLMAMCTSPSFNHTPFKSGPAVPYPVWKMLDNSENTVSRTNFNGEEVYVLNQSIQPDCFGDFPGQGGGVKSGTVSDEVEPIAGSTSIRFGGDCLIRKDDPCYMNKRNTKGKYIGMPSMPPTHDILQGISKVAGWIELGTLVVGGALTLTGVGAPVGAFLLGVSRVSAAVNVVASVADTALYAYEGNMDMVKERAIDAGIGFIGGKLAGAAGSLAKKAIKDGAYIKGEAGKVVSCSLNLAVDAGISLGIGRPVHAFRGAKILMDDDDLDYQGTGYLPFYLQRLYNSQNDNIGWFGQGWASQELEQQLLIHPQHDKIELIDNSGRRIPFPHLKPGKHAYQPYTDLTLYRLPLPKDKAHTTLDGQPILADAESGARLGIEEPLEYMLYPGKIDINDRATYEGIAQHFSRVSSRTIKSDSVVHACVKLSYQTDRYGHSLQLHYTHSASSPLTHLPQYITDAGGNCYQLTFELIGEYPRLKQLHQIDSIDAEGKAEASELAAYTYNNTGDLTHVHRQGKLLRQFGYTDHLITWQQFPTGLEGEYRYDQTHDPKTARVITHTLNNGQHYQFEYIDASHKDQLNQSIVTEQPGTEHERTHQYHYDNWYYLKQYTDPLGHTTKLSYDHLDRVIKVKDPKGGHSLYHYVGRNLHSTRVQIGTDPLTALPLYRSTQFHYQKDKLVGIQDALGNTERLSYTDKGEIASYTDANGNTSTYTYDEHGNLTQHTLASGSSYTFKYNQYGELITQIDCSGNPSNYEYDDKHRLIAIINAKGERTRYHYDNSRPWYDLINHVNYPDGSHISLEHDDAGRLIRHTDAKDQITEYQYSIDNLPIKRIDALGHSLAYDYDNLRRLNTLINENGERWTFEYDSADNLIRETRFDDQQSEYRYDEKGDLTAQIDNPNLARHQQRHVHYQRDLIGQLIAKHAVHYPQAIGEQTNKTKTKPDYERTRFKYDIAGQLISAANGNSRTQLHYDKVGQLISETVTSHDQINGQHTQHRQTLTHEYDEIGNRITTTLPDGKALNQAYYGSGHLYNQSITDTDGSITEIRHSERNELHQETTRYQGNLISAFDYDPMGRLSKQYSSTDRHIAIERHYSYDAIGQLTHVSGQSRLGRDSFKRNHQYQYDKIGRLTQHKLTNYANHTGITEVFAFDPASNRVPVGSANNTQQPKHNSHKSGRPTTLTTHDKYITYTYDSHGRVLFKTQTPLGKDGNPLKQASSGIVGYRKSLQLAYNANHELTQSISITQQGLELTEVITTYQYDAFGRRISKHTQTKNKTRRANKQAKIIKFPVQTQKTKQHRVQYLWDGNRQLQEQTDTHTFTTLYDQDSFEPVARLVWLKDELRQAANDEIKKVERESWEPEPTLIPNMQVYHCHNDQLGTPNELTNDKGEVIWLADYEAWGNVAKIVYKEIQLHNVVVSAEELQPLRFQGQFIDQETGLHYNRFRYFDPDIGMFTTRDPIGLMGGNNVFQYAPNPTGWIDPWGLKKKSRSRKPNHVETKSTGRTKPRNKNESFAMDFIKKHSEKGDEIIKPDRIGDPTFKNKGWSKMSRTVNGVEVHYMAQIDNKGKVINVTDFKFKDPDSPEKVAKKQARRNNNC